MVSAQEKNLYPAFLHLSHEHMQILMQCFSVCAACSKMCIKENRKETAILCADCAEICDLAIKLHSSDSEFSHDAMELCRQACIRCAEECEKSPAEHCKECAKLCRKCASFHEE